MLRVALLILATTLAAWPAEQSVDDLTLRNQPFEPFRVIGGIYYVGPAGVSSFLITTPAGAFLLDGGYQQTAQQIAHNIVELGFRLSDVKYLLNSHVHSDHFGGLAELKRLTGAMMVASEADAYWLQIGNRGAPPVVVDRIIGDGETLSLGGTTLQAHLTPGHTVGSTTWTTTTMDEGRPYRVLFYCSTTVSAPLVKNAIHPHIVEDFEGTFKKMRTLPSDVFLGAHPEFFDMPRKRRRMRPGAPNPFIDPGELVRYVDRSERDFRAELARQTGG